MTVTATFAGVANVLITDGETSILIDGYFSRPSLLKAVSGRLRPDDRKIKYALNHLGVNGAGQTQPTSGHLDAVVVSHSHIDHAFDSPIVADLTGAKLYGSLSTRLIALGYGLERVPFHEIRHGEPFQIGAFSVTPIIALHSDGDHFPGEITEPVTLPASVKDYRTGGCFSFHIAHPDGTVFVHPTANYISGMLRKYGADLLYLGAGTAGTKSQSWIEAYWRETVETLGVKTVRAVHWDAFWRPLTKPLKPIPRPFDRVDVTMSEFGRLAERDGVDVRLAGLWERETVLG